MARVAAIGIDSGEWPVLQRLMAAGRMPQLARLRARSIEVPLEADIVGNPEEAWTELIHGEGEPHEAGYWSNLTFDPSSYRCYRRGAFPGLPFYEAPGRHNLVFDVPKSTIRPGDDVQLTGWGAHAPSYPRSSNPVGLLTELDREVGIHDAWGNDYQPCWYQADFVEGLADQMVDGAARRVDACRWLLARDDGWDLFLTALSETHSAGHHLWHGVDPAHRLAGAPTAALAGRKMGDVHAAVDTTIGGLLDALPSDATTVVFSVHGMRANDSDVAAYLLLPELLHRFDGRPPRLTGPDHGAWAAAGHPPVLPDPRRRPLAAANDYLDVDLAKRVRRAAAASPLLDLERAARRLTGRSAGNRGPWRATADVPPEVDHRLIDDRVMEERAEEFPNLWYRPQWPGMRAFAIPSFGEGRIRVNLRGRERDGIVDPSDYDRTCASIEAVLRETIDPRTGATVVADVERTRRADPFDPHAHDADLLVTWTPGVDAFAHPTLGTIGPFPYLRTGEHSNNGFALVSGPGVERAVLAPMSAAVLPAVLLGLLAAEGTPSGAGLLHLAQATG